MSLFAKDFSHTHPFERARDAIDRIPEDYYDPSNAEIVLMHEFDGVELSVDEVEDTTFEEWMSEADMLQAKGLKLVW